MKKTDTILQFLDGCDGPQTTSDIAAAIDDADGVHRTKALLTYLKNAGRVRQDGERGGGSMYSITAAGRAWFAELKDEAAEDAPKPAKVVKVQAKTAKVQRAPAKRAERVNGTVEPPALPMNGARQIAVRDDGAVLVLEHDVVVTTLHPEDARRIALVVQRLMGAPA